MIEFKPDDWVLFHCPPLDHYNLTDEQHTSLQESDGKLFMIKSISYNKFSDHDFDQILVSSNTLEKAHNTLRDEYLELLLT